MIAPSPIMLWTVALVGLPALAIAALFPAAQPAAWGMLSLLALWCVADALISRDRLPGIAAEFPDVIRMTQDRAADIDVTLTNRTGEARTVRLAISLPRELFSEYESIRTRIEAGQSTVRVRWACTPRRRGNYQLENVYLECLSTLGMWTVRATAHASTNVRVYPNLARDRRSLAALFLNRGLFGIHAQRQVGQGREFEKLREYSPGDSYSDIHWKATAKRGKPVTKLYQVERTQEVYVIIDASRLSARRVTLENGAGDKSEAASTREVTQLERFVSAALVVGLAAERQGDLFGVMTYSDRVHRFIRAKAGKAHYNACRDALYALEPRTVTPDFSEMAAFVRTRLRRRALLLMLTNLDDPVLSESFLSNCALFERQHLVLVNMVTPPDVRPLFTGPPPSDSNEVYARLAGHVIWNDLRELRQTLQRHGVSFSLLQHESLAADLVSQYVNVKQRQLL